MSLCEKNCKYNGYEKDTKNAQCGCTIKAQQLVISNVINQNDLLYYDNFTDQPLSTNIITMKCYYTLFTKDGILKNIGSYLLLFTIILFVVSGILFYKCGYPLLENDMTSLINEKKKKKRSHSKEKTEQSTGKKKKKRKV